MRIILSLLVASMLSAIAAAQPYYARGTFTIPEWDTSIPMTEAAPGHYTATVTGLFDNDPFLFKLGNDDFSVAAPANDGRVYTNVLGEINFHLYTNTNWTDGWSPQNTPRAGYDDPEQFGWEVAGNFNEFSGGAPWHLTPAGNGLYIGQFQFEAGSYEFKFRQQGSWDTSIGNGDFSNSGSNNAFRVWENGEIWSFELDLPNGRWRTYTNAPSPDVNGDQSVDAADYVLWRKTDGSQPVYNAWKKHFGEGPPPPPPGWFARGSFGDPNAPDANGDPWNDLSHQMVDQGGGFYTHTITGLTTGNIYEFKIARSDWSQSSPGSNGKVAADTNGEINFRFWETDTWNDGWYPNNQRRVGYEDPQQFGWEMMGDFYTNPGDDWNTPLAMTDQGNGLYRSADIVLDGSEFQFKFRKQGDWDVTINGDFGTGDNAVLTLDAGTWAFELDLPGGRWRAIPIVAIASGVPEPSAFVLMAIGCLMMLGRQRRQ